MNATATTPLNAAQRIEELGRIIMAYSEVTERLQESHEKLQQQVLALREELGEKNRLLERKNRLAALGEMAAGMAHEIRNPLGGIHLYASMLAKDVAAMPQSLETVKKISGGVKRLEALVSQVLAFSRDIQVNPAAADLAQIVARAIELASPKLDANRVAWEVEGPAEMPVNLDPLLVEQALLNLILNAAEAMEDRGGALRIFYDAGDDVEARQVRLILRDGGPGIPAHVLDRIFDPFFTTKDTGTGLGLAIVHRIVEAHEGTIIASNPPAGGAQFEIRI
ncbi:MAG TPA: ATP-binding protein [Tepidisphaeraceae bacterium]|jgi:two-component system sensor histidine kinase HydH